MNGLFFKRPVESFGNAIGLRLGDEREAWCNAPELDLFQEIISGVLCAVIYALFQSPPHTCIRGAKVSLETLGNRLHSGKPITNLGGVDSDTVGIIVIHC